LTSKRKNGKKKAGQISGEVLMKFAMADPFNTSATPQDILHRFMAIVAVSTGAEGDEDDELARLESRDADADADDDDDAKAEDTSDETDDLNKPDIAEKRNKRLRLARIKRKTKARAYEYTGGEADVVGIVFLEINRITDLPPERNSMLPFSRARHSVICCSSPLGQ